MALIHCDFFSEVLGLNTSMVVILPQAHRAGPSEPVPTIPDKYPTLTLLHGLSDDHTTWVRRTSIERYADAHALAVVMPAVHRSFYTDMVQGHRYWTFISEELPAMARSFFPLSAVREDNFVAGLSMGGYGAFKLGLTHPDRYAAAASLSGAVDIVALSTQFEDEAMRVEMTRVFGDPNHVADSGNDLVHLARLVSDSNGPKPHLYQCCGTEDVLYENNARFREVLESLGLDLTYEQGPGEHEWGYWDQQIQRVLEWLPRG